MPKETPSMVMYAALKRFGLSNREAANLLLNTRLTFDGKMVQDRVDESSQLSRRIVRTAPGELPIGLFNDFHLTCPRLANTLIDNIALKQCGGDTKEAARRLAEALATTQAWSMADALTECGIDPFMYRNMVSYINHVELANEGGRVVLHTMLFVITGCIGDPRTASLLTIDYATNFMGADYHTAPTVIGNVPAQDESQTNIGLGLVRIVDGFVKSGSLMHVLDAEGTELGLLPQTKHTVSDVGEDASRRHAFMWKQDGRWFIRDLGSTNGTRVVSGSTGEETELEPNGTPVAVNPTDVICLGATTRFLVMPVLA